MSDAYNSLLTTKDIWKGSCGKPELFDSELDFEQKSYLLAHWIKNCGSLVVFTGAGISTSSGIPDFRGPKGIWTKEQQEKKKRNRKRDHQVATTSEGYSTSVRFEEAKPSYTHMALVDLANAGRLKLLVSQNVDGLHMFSGFPRANMSELHGNVFLEFCANCGGEEVREEPSGSVGLSSTERKCKRCKEGVMHDSTLDWNDELPFDDLKVAEEVIETSDVVVCMGTSLQVKPASELPMILKKSTKPLGKNHLPSRKLVIINLQSTVMDRKADLVIHGYVDEVMKIVMEKLDLQVTEPQKLPVEHLNRSYARSSSIENVQRIQNKKTQLLQLTQPQPQPQPQPLPQSRTIVKREGNRYGGDYVCDDDKIDGEVEEEEEEQIRKVEEAEDEEWTPSTPERFRKKKKLY